MRLHKPKMENLNLSVLDLQFSPDGSQLLVTTDEAMGFIYDPVSGKQLRYFQARVGGHSGAAAAWLPETFGIPVSQGILTWQRPQLLTASPRLFST